MLLLLLVLGWSLVRQESCDMIELHHMHDANGNPIYEQIIFWDWHHDENKYHVRAWRILTTGERPERLNKYWRIRWNDSGISRMFIAKHYRESWRQNDPERDDKREHPECLRIALRR